MGSTLPGSLISHLIEVLHRALVCPCLDPEVFRNDGRQFDSLGRLVVPESNIGTCLSQGTRDLVANASGAAGYDSNFAVHVKHLEDAVWESRVRPADTVLVRAHCNEWREFHETMKEVAS